MPFTVYVTRDFDHMSSMAAELVEADIAQKLASGHNYVLGLATGNSPTGLYRHLAQACNEGRINPRRVRTFNLDEYVGLPGENAQQRCLHPESYSYFMIKQLFGLMDVNFAETSVPWGTLVDQEELVRALAEHHDDYEIRGTNKGKVIVIRPHARDLLGFVRDTILEGYENKIKAAGGIDLHIVGVGGKGHVAFHESGIPFEGSRVLLISLDDNTIENAISDGHFASAEQSPRYAISMGAELIYEARKVVLLANGSRKAGPVAQSILGKCCCDVPISYGQHYVASGGDLAYVLDEAAAEQILARCEEVEAMGVQFVDLHG
jgi:glucosamine-6-phosphate deaminase